MARPPPLQPQYYTPDPALPAGRATASMVCGILALVMLCVFFPLALPLSAVAVGLGYTATRDARRGLAGGAGMARAGFVCGSIVLALFAIGVAMILFAFLTAALGTR